MSVRYLLPCSCGQTVPIGPSQAGGTVVCDSCEASLEAPRLRDLRELPQAEPEEAPAREWNFGKGVASTLLILAGILAAGGVWFALIEPKAPEPFDISARMKFVETNVEKLTPVQLWQSYVTYYEPMARAGIVEAKSPQGAYTQQVIEKCQRYRNALFLAAGGMALLAAISYPLLPK